MDEREVGRGDGTVGGRFGDEGYGILVSDIL